MMVWCVNPGSQLLPNFTEPCPGTHIANADWNWYSVRISMSLPGALYEVGGQVLVLLRQGLGGMLVQHTQQAGPQRGEFHLSAATKRSDRQVRGRIQQDSRAV